MKRLSSFSLIFILLGIVSCSTIKSASSNTAEFSFSSTGHVSRMEKVTVTVSRSMGSKVTVDWGDGTVDSSTDSSFVHQYEAAGNFEILARCGRKTGISPITVGKLLALSEAVPALAGNGTVWVMAHRAHTSDRSIPENSVAAVNAAVAAGADVLETDTHITKDGVVVICHDQTINATTDGTGDIPSMTLGEIRSFHLKDRAGNVTGEVMPTLEEFLLAARDRAYVNLDYSPRTASARQVMEVVEKLGMVQQVFMYCNEGSRVEEVLELNPDANVYSKHNCYQALPDVPDRYFIQARWYVDDSKAAPYAQGAAEAVAAGHVCSANMLHVLDSKIPEFTVDDSYLKSLLEAFPTCHMIQNDCPDLLVPKLEEMGLR